MPIVSSVIAEDRAQRDGRRSIVEKHTDGQGVVYLVVYLAEAGADVNALVTARVPILNAQLAEAEIAANAAEAIGGNL